MHLMETIKNQLNWADFKKIALSTIIFVVPALIANESVVSTFLSQYINPAIASALVSMIIYWYKQYLSWTDVQTIVNNSIEMALSTYESQQIKTNTVVSNSTEISQPLPVQPISQPTVEVSVPVQTQEPVQVTVPVGDISSIPSNLN